MHLLGDTPSVVNEYLREGLFEEDSVRDFHEATGSPVYVKRVALFDERGLPSRRFHLGGQISVQVDYVVRKDVRQSMILLSIAKDGIYIFQTHDTDLRPGLLEIRKAGEYSARVFLPGNLLTAGLYSLWVGAAVGAQGQYGHDGHPDALSFEIDEEGEDTYFKSYAKSRGMLVIANLEWQTEKTN